MHVPPSRATMTIIVITALCSLLVILSGATDLAAISGGFIPARFSGLELIGAVPAWATPLTATLLHGGLVHLGFNMVMFGYCGRQVEDAVGPRGLVVLYVVGAYAAALAQYLVGPYGRTPMVGASGAISAVLGAYALLYGRRREIVASPRLSTFVHVLWLAAAWIGIQLLMGLASMAGHMSIAVAAHVGGFLAGLALAMPLLLWRYRKA